MVRENLRGKMKEGLKYYNVPTARFYKYKDTYLPRIGLVPLPFTLQFYVGEKVTARQL